MLYYGIKLSPSCSGKPVQSLSCRADKLHIFSRRFSHSCQNIFHKFRTGITYKNHLFIFIDIYLRKLILCKVCFRCSVKYHCIEIHISIYRDFFFCLILRRNTLHRFCGPPHKSITFCIPYARKRIRTSFCQSRFLPGAAVTSVKSQLYCLLLYRIKSDIFVDCTFRLCCCFLRIFLT